MNNPFYKGWLLAVMVTLTPSISCAVGLGQLTILSRLGQPLQAEIELVSVQNDEIPTLSASLASVEAYKGSQLQYNPAFAGLSFKFAQRPDGQPYIQLASRQSVSDPFIDLLVELNWASGRLVREYSALIDPRDYAPVLAQIPAATSVVVAPTASTISVAVPVAPVVLQPQSAQADPAAYGPIKRGETLSKIAMRLKPPVVSMEQMMVGIFRSNPQAFIKNNMNRIRADVMLNIPEMAQVLTLSKSEAIMEVRLLLAAPTRTRQTVAANAVSAPPRLKAEAPKEQAVRKSVLRLSSGS